MDNVGHMTRPGQPSFDPAQQRWFVPIYLRTQQGDVVVGDVEVDPGEHIVYAPSREELETRLATASASGPGEPDDY